MVQVTPMVSSAESFDGERSTRGSPMRWQISDDGKAGWKDLPARPDGTFACTKEHVGKFIRLKPKTTRSIGVGKPQVRKISVGVGEKPIMSTAEFFATLPNYRHTKKRRSSFFRKNKLPIAVETDILLRSVSAQTDAPYLCQESYEAAARMQDLDQAINYWLVVADHGKV
eukprot:g41.t1